jgi:hypothetical protein
VVVVEIDEMAVGVAVAVGGQMTPDVPVTKVRTCLLIPTDQETLGEEIERTGEGEAEDAEEGAEVMTLMTKELHIDLEETGVEAGVAAMLTTDAMLMTRQHHLEEAEGVIIREEGEEGMEDVMAMERQVPEEAGAVRGRMGVGKEVVAITEEVEHQHPTVAHLNIAMKSARPESSTVFFF